MEWKIKYDTIDLKKRSWDDNQCLSELFAFKAIN